MNEWVAIFRTGRHTDSAGNERDWTEEDLDKIVAQYNPAEYEAPAVIGHPVDDAPAYGWVEALKREGAILYAKFKKLVPEFVDIVRQGLFPNRSISLYPDLGLRHVGFLGAMPPAVKGLPKIKFEGGDAYMTIEFAASEEDKERQRARSRKYGIGIKEGGSVTKPSEWEGIPDDDFLDPVNYRYPCPDADQTRAAASYWGMPKNQAQYTEAERATISRRLDEKKKKFKIGEYRQEKGGTNMSVRDVLKSIFTKAVDDLPDDVLQPEPPRTFTEAEVKTKEQEAAAKAKEEGKKEAEREFAEQEQKKIREARKAEISSWTDTMIKEQKLLPAIVKAGLPEVLEFLAQSSETTEFGEEKKKMTHYDLLKGIFENVMPELITFKEVATRDKDTGTGSAGEKLSQMAREKMVESKKEGAELSYSEAFTAVQQENPELAQEYAAEIRGSA